VTTTVLVNGSAFSSHAFSSRFSADRNVGLAPAIIAAAIALPAGRSVPMLLPGSFVHVLGGTDLLLLALAGLAIAIVGALGPATWAARTSTSVVVHTE